MKKVLGWLAGKLKALGGLLIPKLGQHRGAGFGTFWRFVLVLALHLVVLAILYGLYELNIHNTGIQEKIKADEWTQKHYLPVLGVLVYFFFLFCYLLVILFGPDEGPRFPDIDQAWADARKALSKAGLAMNDLPLILILGDPDDESGDRALLAASGFTIQTPRAPHTDEAPLHVYASRDAIFLTCAGASQLGYYARWLSTKVAGITEDDIDAARSSIDIDIAQQTLNPDRAADVYGGGLAEMTMMLQHPRQEGRAAYSKGEMHLLRWKMRQDKGRRSPLQDPGRMAEQAARLRYLCRLLVRERHPYCAVNGVLVLVPFAGTDSEQDATDTAQVIRGDLAVTGATLKVQCPHVTLMCDLESAPGFAEFVRGFTDEQRRAPIGKGCPLKPDFRTSVLQTGGSQTAPMTRMLESLAQWVCQSVVPSWVYHKFRVEKSDNDQPAAIVRANVELFLMGDTFRERGRRLGTILARGLRGYAEEGTLLFGGCYLAGTGSSDPQQEQGFVRGVLERLREWGKTKVYWNPRALADEAAVQRWSVIGWTVLGILALAELAGAVFLFRHW